VEPGRRRRWPYLIAVVVLTLADIFMVLAFAEGVADTDDTEGRTSGLIVLGVAILLLTWLAAMAIRAFARRGHPEPTAAGTGMPLPVRVSNGRKIAGTFAAVVFYGIALLIVGVEVADMVHGDFSGASGLTGAAVCAALGSLGLTMRKTPSAARRAELLTTYNQAVQQQGQGWAQFSPGAPQPLAQPSWVQFPVDRTVTYRESMSEAWWRGLAASVVLGAALIWGMTRMNSNSSWALLLVIPMVAVAVALIVFLIFLPYGIRLAGGVLSVGALGVPRGGRVWRRQDLPLDEVVAWTIRPRVRREMLPIPSSPFPDGNRKIPALTKGVAPWGSFMGPGVRNVLIVRVDPTRVPAAMPAVVMSGYNVQDSSRSLRDIGVYFIGTRRADRLAQTLDKAMPSRRSLT